MIKNNDKKNSCGRFLEEGRITTSRTHLYFTEKSIIYSFPREEKYCMINLNFNISLISPFTKKLVFVSMTKASFFVSSRAVFRTLFSFLFYSHVFLG